MCRRSFACTTNANFARKFRTTLHQWSSYVGDLHQTMRGGNAFSASNGFELFLGLGDAVAVTRLEVLFTDGTMRVLEDVAMDQRIAVALTVE